MPLNSYLSLNMAAYDNNEDDSVELMDTFNSNTIEDPLETIMKKEYYEQIHNNIEKSLSKFEKQVLDRFMKGESYNVIAKRLDSPVKSVDNAIQRIRKKAVKNMFKMINKISYIKSSVLYIGYTAFYLVLPTGIEPVTSALPRLHSTN